MTMFTVDSYLSHTLFYWKSLKCVAKWLFCYKINQFSSFLVAGNSWTSVFVFCTLCLFSYTEIKRLHICSYRDYRIAGSVWQLISVAVHKQGLAGNLGFSTSYTQDKFWIEQTFICILARVCLYCVVSLHSFSNGCVLCSLLTIVLSYPYYTSISDVFALDVLHLLHVPYCL